MAESATAGMIGIRAACRRKSQTAALLVQETIRRNVERATGSASTRTLHMFRSQNLRFKATLTRAATVTRQPTGLWVIALLPAIL